MQAFFDEVPPIEYRQLISLGVNHQRVFYYDAVDYEPRPGETVAHTEARITERVTLHRQINTIPNFHVREGYVSTGRKPRQREQKAVDVQLAVDAIEQAALRNMSHATLLLGDLDFQPLIAALVRFGIRVTVFYEQGAREELLEVADERHPLRLAEYSLLSPPTFRANHTFPQFNPVGTPAYPAVIRNGSWKGNRVVLAGHTTGAGAVAPFELFIENGDEVKGQNLAVHFSGPAHDRIGLAFELGYGGTIEWQ